MRSVGIALDIGTSKIEGLLVDLATGAPLAYSEHENNQRAFGPDVISRLNLAVTDPSGSARLQAAAVKTIETTVSDLLALAKVDARSVARLICVGNSVMHHLALSLSPRTLARAPFRPAQTGLVYRASPRGIGLKICERAEFVFMPNLGGFVGSDALAVIIATRLHTSHSLIAAFDIGSNGEVIVGDRRGILVASTSAGPAFEGWRISCGMPALDGAVESVRRTSHGLAYTTIGGAKARGLCGSGLIDLIAYLLRRGVLDRSGRLKGGAFKVAPSLFLTQRDVRELQLAKAAIQAALNVLAKTFLPRRLSRIILTGRFGGRLAKGNVRAIGMLPRRADLKDVEVLQHGALRGARLILCSRRTEREALGLSRTVSHVELHKEPEFQDEFIRAMRF